MSKSIRAKLLRVVILALLLMAIFMGTAGVLAVNRLATTNSEEIMTGICNEQTYRLDGKLNVVKHSADLIYEYLQHISTGNLALDYMFLTQYEDVVEKLALSVANQTEGSMAVYFRYDPEIAGTGTAGFFYSRKSDDEVFVREETTDILKYNKNDIEHVGWFYVPKESGEAMWMSPYYNKNLDVYMISYVIPIYTQKKEFIGVVGMDIDFNTIMSATDTENFYDNGVLALVDLSERLMYSVDENGEAQEVVLDSDLYNHITTINKKSALLKVTDGHGNTSMIRVSRLSNGMMLYVNVPSYEIYEERNHLILVYLSIGITIFAVSIVLVSRSAKAIIRPLKKLSQVATQYAAGDWSETYINKSSTEIQILSEDISIMAANTQEYIRRINTIARRDSLTGLGNKTAYVEMVEDIKRNRQDKYSRYEIFVMDLNLLKKANDTYGHEAGDALLKEAGRYIGATFKHSAVFRIGGDEFAAILASEDYDNREELTKSFEDGMGYTLQGEYPVQLFISFGGAVYGVDGTDFDELFKIADDRMYAKKKEMKMGRTDSTAEGR